MLRQPHVPRTFGAALVGRFSYGLIFLSLVVALSRATGSYAWAGTALACFGLSTSFLAPLRARLIDRRGPRRVLPVMAVAYAVLLAALTVATWGPGTPVWALVALTLSAGACAPPLGPVMRALWSDLMPDREMRQRAFSLDTVAEELLYVVGPLVAGLFIAFGNPALGVGVSALLALAGSLALAYAPITRRDRSDREAAGPAEPGPGAPVGATGPFAPAVVAGGVGVSLGALDLLVVAFAERHHHIAAVAWIQAALSVGSAVGGLAYGARAWRLTSRQRLPLLAVALSVSLGAAGLAPGIFPLAVAVGCAGLFVAPTLSTAYMAADECATPETRVRAGTWVNSAFNAGSSGGTTAAGLALGRFPLWLCFVAAALPTLASSLPATTTLPRFGRTNPDAAR
ncbi:MULTISPECIES: MFS transporter [unclassified Streptomyces]|uniref:MFS transporter n=1 Tax=unclassified Streptomyces TaxID=2593676 RepID=UPI002E28ED64|nr:MFS transporter [Streptomyces sp. NBC_00223]